MMRCGHGHFFKSRAAALPMVLAVSAILLTLCSIITSELLGALALQQPLARARRYGWETRESALLNGNLNCREGEFLRRAHLPSPYHLSPFFKAPPRGQPVLDLGRIRAPTVRCFEAAQPWRSGERTCANSTLTGSAIFQGNYHVTPGEAWNSSSDLIRIFYGDLLGEDLRIVGAQLCIIQVFGDLVLRALDAQACSSLVILAPLGTARIEALNAPPLGVVAAGPGSSVQGILPTEVPVLQLQNVLRRTTTLGFRPCTR